MNHEDKKQSLHYLNGFFLGVTAFWISVCRFNYRPYIGDALFEYLNAIPRAVHDPHVFQYRGKSVKDIRTGLAKACEEVGIQYGRFRKGGFIFHDLRHTFNTNMRKAGISESVIMEITGHSTREMFDRYNTIDEEDTRNAVRRLGSFLKSVD